MATKTISIDIDAYRRLKKTKRGGESFSDVIKRVVKTPADYREWLRRVQKLPPMDSKAVEAIEQLRARRVVRLRKAS